MAIFFRAKNSFSCRLQSLITLQQRLCHLLVEQTLPYPRMLSSHTKFQKSSLIDMTKWKKINANFLGIKRSMIPQSPWLVLSILRNKGFEAYLVGGCVRDLLLRRIPKDFDVITTANLKQIKRQFHRCEIVGQRFPICRVHVKGSVVEVSSFDTVAQSSEGKEEALLFDIPSGCDGKDFIRWRNSMQRDFTINSLFFDPFKNKIFDYANGMSDLRSLKLRTVVPAHLSFQEDCARILRGLRIAGRLGLSISKETEIAMCKLSSSINTLAKSRIMMELNYMLAYGASGSTFYLLQRFKILELFLPFQAAYLSQQAGETSSQDSIMLMKLFFNLDTLVSCDRPCNSTLWVGILAFHQALVTDPQDALVIWAFASVLYHGNWKEGVEFARENANVHVKFVPEISGLSECKSDEELAEEVGHLAALVQDSLGAMMNVDILADSMSKFGVSLSSSLVFVTKKVGNDVAQLFDVLTNNVESYNVERESFMINYFLLGKGDKHESRFVLGKVILETLGGITEGLGISEGTKVIEEKHNSNVSELVQGHIVESKDKNPTLLQFDHEHKQTTGNKRKLMKTKCSSGQEAAAKKEKVFLNDQLMVMAKESPKIVETAQFYEREASVVLINPSDKQQQHSHKISRKSSLGMEVKVDCEEKKDCHELMQEVVKRKTENLEQPLEKQSARPSLYTLFRR